MRMTVTVSEHIALFGVQVWWRPDVRVVVERLRPRRRQAIGKRWQLLVTMYLRL